MNSDVGYWLVEVESLQRQLAEAKQQRDEAHQDAQNWRQRYETEAQQRRRDNQVFRNEIQTLRQSLTQLQALTVGLEGLGSGDMVTSPPQGSPDPSPRAEGLERQVQTLSQQCDRLREALQQERQAHRHTRESLTIALGDAVEQLSKLKPPQD